MPASARWTAGAPTVRWARAMILAGCAGLVVLIPLMVWTSVGQRVDERSRWSAVVAPDFEAALWEWLLQVSVPLVAAGALITAAIALVRRRLDLAVAAVVVIGAGNVTTQLGKALVPRVNHGVGVENTLPSGHMTVITSLLLALLIVVPRVLRLPVAVVTAFTTTLAGASIVILRWHRPSDVIAAVGVLAVWAGLSALAAAWIRGATRTELSSAQDVGFGSYLLVALASSAMAGLTLFLGGLGAHEEPINALVGGVTFSLAGLVASVLVAMTATAFGGLDQVRETPPT